MFLDKQKRIIVVILIFGILASVLLLGCENKQNQDVSHSLREDRETYSKALEFLEEGKYAEAYYALKSCLNFEDSKELIEKFSVTYKTKEFVYYTKTGTIWQHYKEEYDANGNKVLYVEYDSDGTIKHKYRFEYDYYEDKNIKTILKYTDIADFEVIHKTSKTEYKRNKNGNIICIIQYDFSGDILNTYMYKYNDSGEQILSTKYKYNNIIENQIEYEYDEYGLLVSEKQYDKNGQLKETTKYTYDKSGNTLSESKVDLEGNITYKIERRYDKHEREILYTAYEINDEDLIVKYKLEHQYDNNGEIIGSIEYDANDTICNKRKYEYDENGHRLRYFVRDVEGWLRHEVKYGEVLISYNP